MKSKLSTRRGRGAAVALLGLAIALVAVLIARASSPPPRAAASAGTPSGAATVERRDLVATDTESGTLSYVSPQTVYDRLSGTVTWLPSVGQVIRPGQTLFKVDRTPVILLNGRAPAYRDLSPNDSAGPDILELNRNLAALDFDRAGIVVNDMWQAATTYGVELLQKSLGETETGTLPLGQIVFLPGSQLVSTVDGSLGATGGSSSNSGSANASYSVPGGTTEFVDLHAPSATTPSTPSTTTTPTTGSGSHPSSSRQSGNQTQLSSLQALIALLKAEIAELKSAHPQSGGSPASSSHGGGAGSSSGGTGSPSSSGSKGGSSSSSGGTSPSSSSSSGTPSSSSSSGGQGSSGSGGSANATAILQTTSTELVATVDLDASKQSEATVGEHVTVELPAGNTVEGTITSVSSVAQTGSGSSGSNNGNGNSGNGNSGNGNSGNGNSGNGNGNGNSSASTVPVTIALPHGLHAAGLDQASVSVLFQQASARNVLSVPVTALLATGGASYAVQSATAPHTLIPVSTGLFAAGYVQISGPGIYAGLAVTDSQG